MHTIAGEPILEGKYHLECRLGQGGMGVVYKARHAYLKTQLAIKIILPDLVGNDPQLVTRFRQEALAAAAIRHQNVVSVTDYGVINGAVPFLVMEYVEGESLHDLLAREKTLSPTRALELMSAICAGVGAAHHQGIVHRDLKPLNIMICSDKPNLSQAVKILDFGLAKIKSGELLGSFIQAQTTGLMGSPYYMAPEQWADDDPDSRSDIYSLGVMLFQMLAGDVPFKGSSIPAIMKKHISDPPPTFAELGLNLPLDVESAVRRTLQKEKEKRTPSVEAMIEELRMAVEPSAYGIHTTSSADSSFAAASLNILTEPPKSSVYIDNVAVGTSRDDGWLVIEGMQSGTHHLRISHAGFEDWTGNITCGGQPQRVVAQLRTGTTSAQSSAAWDGALGVNTPHNFSSTRGDSEMQKTALHNWDTGRQHIGVKSQPPKRSFFSPLVIVTASLIGLFSLFIVGIGGAYFSGILSEKRVVTTDVSNVTAPAPVETPAPTKADLVAIPGGTFTMGRNGGPNIEGPPNQAVVNDFSMDKTEVTNGEYNQFVQAVNYKDIPAHWVNGKPIAGQETMPVRFVNAADAEAFAAWRSKRDGVTYRLPTEQEWEYAARNGAQDNLYPWGDKFEARCAMLNQANNEPASVGSRSCPNAWGVQDLIGNVFEWTASEPSLYPGSTGSMKTLNEKYLMVRGGSAFQKSTGPNSITSTFRIAVPASRRSAELGFRLVRAD